MYVIGIAGSSGSGKTTLVRQVIEALPKDAYSIIPQDSYYRDNSHLEPEARQLLNFDHPRSIEFELLNEHVEALKKGNAVDMPQYSYLTCSRLDETVRVHPRKLLIIEGILIFTHEPLVEKMDLKVFVDADPDDRLGRVIQRDIKERGRDVDTVLERYNATVKPMDIQFIQPSKVHADIIVPKGGKNSKAIGIISAYLKGIV